MTLVRFGLSPRKTGLSRAAMQEHWKERHAQLFSNMPGLRSYIQNHAILGTDDQPLLGDPGFDIFSEVQFGDGDDFLLAVQSAYFRDSVLPDEQQLLDAAKRTFLLAQPVLVTGNPSSGAYKLVYLLNLSDGCVPTTLTDGDAITCQREAQGMICYAVKDVSGFAFANINCIVQLYYESLAAARARHQADRAGHADSLVQAVIAHELQVVPRVLNEIAGGCDSATCY